jgi:hypothetical protein
MLTIYDKWVGIAVPEHNVNAANAMAASITGNDAEMQTFVRRAFSGDGTVFYVTMVPMRDSVYDQLPSMQTQLDGNYEVLASRNEFGWNRIKSFEEWLEQVGLILEEWESEFDEETSAV